MTCIACTAQLPCHSLPAGSCCRSAAFAEWLIDCLRPAGGAVYYMARTTWDSIEPYVFQQQYRAAQVRGPGAAAGAAMRAVLCCAGRSAAGSACAAACRSHFLCPAPHPQHYLSGLTLVASLPPSHLPLILLSSPRCWCMAWTWPAAASSLGHSCGRHATLRRRRTGTLPLF